MMIKEAAKSCLGWEGINDRILIAHFTTKKFRVVYAPVGPTDGDASDSRLAVIASIPTPTDLYTCLHTYP